MKEHNWEPSESDTSKCNVCDVNTDNTRESSEERILSFPFPSKYLEQANERMLSLLFPVFPNSYS